jgi:hypothetical protein
MAKAKKYADSKPYQNAIATPVDLMSSETAQGDRGLAFVLMPFANEFRDVYLLGIQPSCLETGFRCERVDEQLFYENIMSRIYDQIKRADLLIADMTGRNANVFYEVGMPME